ncbi:MAG: vanadium-dependent haloperoxidase [Gemmatimonadales bacterium]
MRILPWAAVLTVGCSARVPSADTGFVAKWTATHYALARAERLSPPVASRVSAYAAIALYEGWAAFSDSLLSLTGQLNGLDSLPRPSPGERYDPALVGMEAQTVVLRDLYQEGFASTDVVIAALRDSLLQIRESQGIPGAVRDRSLAYGQQLGAAIAAWAATDGFAGRSLAYEARAGDQYWQPTATEAQYRSQMLSGGRDFVGLDNPTAAARPGVIGDRAIAVDRPKRPENTTAPGINLTVALEPHWGELRPFALRSADSCPPPPPVPFSTRKGSPFYQEAMAVYEASRTLTPEQKAIAYFWADNPGETGTPAGHWMSVISQLAEQRQLSPERTVELYALTAIAVADAFIQCWHVKYTYNLLRPVSYIQRYLDPEWQPYIITPSFPSYTAGHSSQSAAAAEVLTALLGDSTPYTDATHVSIGHPPKRLASFRAAAAEAAISRLYGGIHYPADNEQGAVAGRCVGQSVLARIHTRRAD